MRKSRKRKPPAKPKLRNVWSIRPSSRVKESKKKYSRPRTRKTVNKLVKEIDWFSER